MKVKDVMRVLQITRGTVSRYVAKGIIGYEVLPNGRYEYNEKDVYAFLNRGVPRRTYIYGRVSTPKQKPDLENQLLMLKQFCFANGYTISGTFSDIASGVSFEKRKSFFEMLDDIVAGKVERVVITYKDRLSRVGFDLFQYLFAKYNCEIVVMSEAGSEKLDEKEIFEEIVSLLHCYSMKIYSNRRKMLQLKEVIRDGEDETAEGAAAKGRKA